MEKIDFKKTLKHLYKPSAKQIEIIEVPKMNYIMVDGQGDPNTSQSFQDTIETLYPLAYTLKFMAKLSETGVDYTVMPLEGLWWADDMSTFLTKDKDKWKWTLMIMQPEFITQDMFQKAVEQIRAKKNPVFLPLARFESYEEGKSAQIMYTGPFSEEGPTVEKIHAFINENGAQIRGKHHEIYLSDLRRVAPEKMRTVIRQPMT